MYIFRWIISLVLLSILSYFRETLFLGVNEIIDGNFKYNPYSYQPKYLIEQSKEDLLKLKFILTALFSLLFACFTIWALKISFKTQLPYKLSLLVYTLIFIVAIIIILFSAATNTFNNVYPFLRGIIDYIHNPLLFIVLSTTILANDALNKKHFK